MTNEPRLLSPTEAAERLNISRAYLYPLLMGRPPAIRSIKLGKRRLIPTEAVEEFVQDQLQQQDRMG